jgi:hypothetical protein
MTKDNFRLDQVGRLEYRCRGIPKKKGDSHWAALALPPEIQIRKKAAKSDRRAFTKENFKHKR